MWYCFRRDGKKGKIIPLIGESHDNRLLALGTGDYSQRLAVGLGSRLAQAPLHLRFTGSEAKVQRCISLTLVHPLSRRAGLHSTNAFSNVHIHLHLALSSSPYTLSRSYYLSYLLPCVPQTGLPDVIDCPQATPVVYATVSLSYIES